MPKNNTKKLNKPKLKKGVCPSCWGKKYNSVMNREIGRNYDSGSHIDNIPCSYCKGTGKDPKFNNTKKKKEVKPIKAWAVINKKDKFVYGIKFLKISKIKGEIVACAILDEGCAIPVLITPITK